VAKILGDRFATISGTDDAAYRFVEEIIRSVPSTTGTQASDDADTAAQVTGQENEVEEKKVELRLLMLLKDFDDKLLKEAVRIISA